MISARASIRIFAIVLVGTAFSAACAGRLNDDVWRPFAEWSYSTSIGTVIHESGWLFAVIESVHLVGLAVMGGAVFVVDLRLIGGGLNDESAAALAREMQPILLGSFIVMVASGLLLYLSEATKFYSEQFWDSAEFPFIYKMLFLALAVLFTFTIRRIVLSSDTRPILPIWRKLTGLVSMLLWLGVAVGGRGIGFY